MKNGETPQPMGRHADDGRSKRDLAIVSLSVNPSVRSSSARLSSILEKHSDHPYRIARPRTLNVTRNEVIIATGLLMLRPLRPTYATSAPDTANTTAARMSKK